MTEWRKSRQPYREGIPRVLQTADLPIKLSEKQAKIAKADTTDFKKGNGTGPYVCWNRSSPALNRCMSVTKITGVRVPILDALELTRDYRPALPVSMRSLQVMYNSLLVLIPRAYAWSTKPTVSMSVRRQRVITGAFAASKTRLPGRAMIS